MNSLIIGNTSQISYYFPQEYERISSRYIDFNLYNDKFYDRIFFCFGENRTFLKNIDEEFIKINVSYTISLLLFFKDHCNKLIVYGTAELWNKCDGPIDINTPINFYSHPYINSKKTLIDVIKYFRKIKLVNNVIIIHPFNFNSIHRKGDFLFGKIYDSILNKKKIEIGDTDFYRDLTSPEEVVKASITSECDEIVGSGTLTHVNSYIRNLYEKAGLIYEDYVTHNSSCSLNIKRKNYYKKV